MVLVGDQYLDELFISHVDDLQAVGETGSRTQFLRLRMAHTLRLLVTAGRGNDLAARIQARYATPLWVLVPEPISGNTPREQLPLIPENVRSYATPITDANYPFGTEAYYHKPYTLNEYIVRPLGVLMGRSVNARELIRFLANKLGGSHADHELIDDDRNVDSETLFYLNNRITVFGEGAIFHLFDACTPMIWRSLAPLRDEVAAARRQNVQA